LSVTVPEIVPVLELCASAALGAIKKQAKERSEKHREETYRHTIGILGGSKHFRAPLGCHFFDLAFTPERYTPTNGHLIFWATQFVNRKMYESPHSQNPDFRNAPLSPLHSVVRGRTPKP